MNDNQAQANIRAHLLEKWWSVDPPKTPGWYWYRDKDDDEYAALSSL
jgi:hypothetical protein